MSDMPEQIYADPKTGQWFAHQSGCNYVRADLHAELEAEVERLTRERDDALMVKREAIAGWRDAEALSRTGAVKVDRQRLNMEISKWATDSNLHITIGDVEALHEAILSALEPAAPEGQQEAAAWQSQDLIESASYVSKNFGLVRYEGIDRYFGQSTHKFSTGHGARYVLPEALNDFLSPKPVTRPSEQAVTEAARAVCDNAKLVDIGKNGAFNYVVSPYLIDALKTAMEAGR